MICSINKQADRNGVVGRIALSLLQMIFQIALVFVISIKFSCLNQSAKR